MRGEPHIIRLAQIPLDQRAQLFLVRFNQFNIADIKRCGESIAGTINNTAQSMPLRVFHQLRQVFDADARRQTAANYQQRAGGDSENFFLNEAELIRS